MYVYVRFVRGFFSFFVPLRHLRLIIVQHFLEKCGNAAMLWSGKNCSCSKEFEGRAWLHTEC